MTDFSGVVAPLARALSERGYATPTPVQEAVLAPGLEGADLLVSAQTGSGKTVAFGMAIAPTLLQGADGFERPQGWIAPLALVVAPTRELALQVCRELEWLYAPARGRVVSCVGGMDMRGERQALNSGAHIVVGTPGRLRDHIERGSLDISALRAVVLDEADEMLDLGFREDLEYILDAAPADRRTLLFSATVPKQIAQLAKRFQRDAVRLSTVQERSQHGDIEYRALQVAPNERENAIINLLRHVDAQSAIVFCGTRMAVTHLTARLSNRGFVVVALSGELSQNERTHALQAMRDGRARVCVATDVAARGIDLPGLELVIHADPPVNADTLLHRSGRTGRAGKKGICALIVPHNRRKSVQRLLQEANVQARWGAPPTAAEILAQDRRRLVEDPMLVAEPTDDELGFARALLERHGAEKVAAAFLRQHMARYPAPEELLDAVPEIDAAGPSGAPRERFSQGVWFRITAGHKQNAEPRWLLPLICRVGHVTKRDIGAIKIFHTESRFEISTAAADRFEQQIAREGTGEKAIAIARLTSAEVADMPAEAGKKPAARPFGKKPAWKGEGGDKPFRPKFKPRDRDGTGDVQPDRRPDSKGGKPKNR